MNPLVKAWLKPKTDKPKPKKKGESKNAKRQS